MDRVNAVNASKVYAFKVKSAVLFGSVLSSADGLGDVDVAIDLRRRISDSAKFREHCDRRRHLAEEQGRAFSTAIDWATWPEKEVVLQLKALQCRKRFGEISDEWYVFPWGKPRPSDPTRHITSFKTA
jgi:hypothetical protein